MTFHKLIFSFGRTAKVIMAVLFFYNLRQIVMRMYKGVLKCFPFFLFMAFYAIVSCCRSDVIVHDGVRSHVLDSLSRVWNACSKSGEYDSLVSGTRTWFSSAVDENDTAFALKSGLAMAQAFIFMERFDSAEIYLRYLQQYESPSMDPQVGVGLNSVLGIYSVKSKSDYSAALQFYYEGLSWARKEGNVNNMIALLCNITQIFYILSDGSGKVYADSAYALMQSNDVSDYIHAHTLLSRAQMEYLSGNDAAAGSLVAEAGRIAEGNGLMSLYTAICLLKADIMADTGMMERAGRLYGKALAYSEYSEPSIHAIACLHYGDFCRQSGQYNASVRLYRTGLSLMADANRKDFYIAMAEAFSLSGHKDSALRYYGLYAKLERGDSSKINERQFNELLRSYQKAEYDNRLQRRELELLRERKRLNSILYIAVIAVIVAFSVSVLYMKQKSMYRKLALQHEKFRLRMESVHISDTVPARPQRGDDTDMKLFIKMERLMDEEKVYMMKGLTLDKMAEIMGTNRTYLSNAVNKFAKMDFISYVDMYRIKEASKIISNNGSIPVKQLADAVGYNSISVFYKAFKHETGLTPGQYGKSLQSVTKPDVSDS